MSTTDPRSATSGQTWAYRKRGIDPLVEIEVVRQGKRRPPRILVRFVDKEFEGHEDWVPSARLKVLWAEVDEFRASEQRWRRIREIRINDDDPRFDAADAIFTELVDDAYARLEYREGGATRIVNTSALLSAAGLRSEDLEHPASFTDNNQTIVPWEITERIIEAAVLKNPAPVLNHILLETIAARRAAVHGHTTSGSRPAYISPSICIEVDAELTLPVLDQLRRYCGSDLISAFDELNELRLETRRIYEVALSAIRELDHAGEKMIAQRLRSELEAYDSGANTDSGSIDAAQQSPAQE